MVRSQVKLNDLRFEQVRQNITSTKAIGSENKTLPIVTLLNQGYVNEADKRFDLPFSNFIISKNFIVKI